ncbi:MAG: ATP-binding protein [Nibricoccus sp.]
MTFSTALWALIASLIIGVSAVCVNPRRLLNRMVLSISVHLAVWLGCLHCAFVESPGVEWRQRAAIVAAGLVWQLWLLKSAVLKPSLTLGARLSSSWPWLVFWVVLTVVTFGGHFVSMEPGSDRPVYGISYYTYATLFLSGCVGLVGQTFWAMRGVQGGQRLELQVLMLGGAVTAFCGLSMVLIDSWLAVPGLLRLMPLVVMVCCGGTVWAVVTTRVLDAHHILVLCLERIGLVATVGLFVWGIEQLAGQFVPASVAFVVALAFGLWFAAEIAPWMQELFQRQTRGNRVRHAAFEVAREELRPDAMDESFVKLLREWAGCERAVILMGSHGRLTGDGLEFAVDSPEMEALSALRWVTPERLAREKSTEERRALQALLEKHGFGVIAASIGPSPALVVGLSVPLSRRPYTYPEVGVLLQLAAIFENSLSRAHYLMKAQHAEQLATVGLLGASIAHEIRNPLVSIKTFVQLLPNHYQEAAFREKFFRLIGDEVGRIDRLTEQLLDLSAPRVFSSREVEVHPLLRSCLDLMAAKAEDKGVRLLAEFEAESDQVFTDPNAIKQVMLNLGFNAIQALERHSGERWLRLKTRKVADNVEIAVVDSGPGLAPEVWARLFQPFQSTKSSGFGLGLAICKDILSSLQASITADPPETGRGATFRIVLPCPPPPTS